MYSIRECDEEVFENIKYCTAKMHTERLFRLNMFL